MKLKNVFEDYNAHSLGGFVWDTRMLVEIGAKLLKRNLALAIINFSTICILCFAELKLKNNMI